MEHNIVSQKTILVVDDKESERMLLEVHLREWGFIPLLAQDGIEALDILRKNHVDLQSKLLRVLQERTYEKTGSNQPIKANSRIIATTHRDLQKMVTDGEFRKDLYHRINLSGRAI